MTEGVLESIGHIDPQEKKRVFNEKKEQKENDDLVRSMYEIKKERLRGRNTTAKEKAKTAANVAAGVMAIGLLQTTGDQMKEWERESSQQTRKEAGRGVDYVRDTVRNRALDRID